MHITKTKKMLRENSYRKDVAFIFFLILQILQHTFYSTFLNTITHLLTHKRNILEIRRHRIVRCRVPWTQYLAPQSVSGKDYMSSLRLLRKVNYPQLLAKTLINSYTLHFQFPNEHLDVVIAKNSVKINYYQTVFDVLMWSHATVKQDVRPT